MPPTRTRTSPRFTILAGIALLAAFALHAATARALDFAVTLDDAAAKAALSAVGADPESGKLTGRLYVFLSQRDGGEPMRGPDWFAPEPFFGVDVRDVRAGDRMMVNQRADGFPESLSKLPAGKYRAQAILDTNPDAQNHARGVGNAYSEVVEIEHDPEVERTVELALTKNVDEEPFPKRPWLHEIELPSERLSKFHNRRVVERACVILPEGYEDRPQRRYPVIYEIPGFGGTHRPPPRSRLEAPKPGENETDFIRVLLSGNCKWGHHCYADSATNGPRGAALIEEMIPHIDANFRTVAAPTARFVTGHSSGGWTSLWLQVTYPETFGGCWSTSPDPVDFRDYQQVDLYADPPLSLYFDPQGERRPIARRGREPVLWYDAFGKMDDVLGRGGQLRSFEAVFSPLDTDGLPRKLWDRRTGQIDPEVARAWQAYDINLVLSRNWPALRDKLAGKLRVVTGELDTFYLEGAVRLLGETLRELGSDAEVVIVPERSHSNLRTPELTAEFRRAMTRKFREHHPED